MTSVLIPQPLEASSYLFVVFINDQIWSNMIRGGHLESVQYIPNAFNVCLCQFDTFLMQRSTVCRVWVRATPEEMGKIHIYSIVTN